MSKHKTSRRLTTESIKELSEIDRSQAKHAIYRKPGIPDVDEEMKHTRVDSKGPLINKVPFGDEDKTTREQSRDRFIRGFYRDERNNPGPSGIRPPKPTQKDRSRIIQAKLTLMKMKTAEILRERNDRIRTIDKFLEDSPHSTRIQDTAVTNPAIFRQHFKQVKKYVDTGEKINPNESIEGPKIDPKKRKKYAKIIDYTSHVIRRKNQGADKETVFNELVDSHGVDNVYARSLVEKIRWDKTAKGINCSPCTIKAMSRMRVQLATMKKIKSTSDDIVDRFENFLQRRPNIKDASGVFDHKSMRILDANIPSDAVRLHKMYGNGDKLIGFNSITDTRLKKEDDPNIIRGQLRKIESKGGIPVLGFDKGSLEAVDIAHGSNDNEILGKLLPHQNSTGILDPGARKFRIVENPNYSLTWKE